MKNSKNERFYEKYAWIIFLIIGVLVLVGAIPHMLGFNTDPALVETISGESIEDLRTSNPEFFNLYNFYFTGGGLSDLGFAIFLIVISVFAYRRGEKWAWYSLWSVPAFFLGWIFLSLALPPESQSSLVPPLTIFIVLSVVGLLLPFRKFFPKQK